MRQLHHNKLGLYGCYLLSLIMWAERIIRRSFNDVSVYEICLINGWVDEDCYVISPDRIMRYLVGGTWTVRHESKTYVIKENDVVIERWGLKRQMAELAHFKPPWGDPYGESQIVKEGELVSYRILTRVA